MIETYHLPKAGPYASEFCGYEIRLYFTDDSIIRLAGCHDTTPDAVPRNGGSSVQLEAPAAHVRRR